MDDWKHHINKTLNEMSKGCMYQPTEKMRKYANSLSTQEQRTFAHEWITQQ